MPRFSLGRKVVEEVWIGKEVDYSLMRIFGCLAYVHIPSKERSKLGSKGYKLWDPVVEKVVISKDVVLEEKSMIKAIRKEEESQVVGSSSESGKSVAQVELDKVEP